jgi:PAS domain S-box-containing protein
MLGCNREKTPHHSIIPPFHHSHIPYSIIPVKHPNIDLTFPHGIFYAIYNAMKTSNLSSRTIKIDIRPLAYEAKPQQSNPELARAQTLLSQIDYRFLFDRAYAAILLVDKTGQILSWNPRALDFFGYPPEELARKNIQTVIAGMNEMILATIRETVQRGQHMRIQAFGMLNSGEMNALELVISGNGLTDKDHFCCLIKNIQAQWQTEQSLSSAYHAMDNTDSGIGIVNMAGVIVYANRTMIRLLADGDEAGVLGKPLTNWFDNTSIVHPLMVSIKKQECWSAEKSILIGEKSCCFSLSAVPDINSDNELSGMVLSIRDVAENRRLELAQQQAARDRTILESLGSICHTLTQPMTVLLTSIELLKLETGIDEEQKKEIISLCYDTVLNMREQLVSLNSRCMEQKPLE